MHDIGFSYEFFPPSNLIGERRFWRTLGCLEVMDPSFFSITYGALGSGQSHSITAIENVVAESEIPVAAHLTFEGSTIEEINQVARQLSEIGVDRIVALRGDDRENAADAKRRGPCYQSVPEFIAGLLEIYPFDISVACYPEVHPRAASALEDIQLLKAKFDAGANRAITQFFFDLDEFDRFCERAAAAGVTAPIVPGVLPIRDFNRMTQFAARCGTTVPGALHTLFEPSLKDPQLMKHLAQQQAEQFIDDLIVRGFHHFHIYTLNQTIDLRQCVDQAQRMAPNSVAANV